MGCAIHCQINMKTKAKSGRKHRRGLSDASEFFLQLGLSTYQDRARFLLNPGSNQQEKAGIYIPSLSGNSQPFCLGEY
jgi:hypothetical protein